MAANVTIQCIGASIGNNLRIGTNLANIAVGGGGAGGEQPIVPPSSLSVSGFLTEGDLPIVRGAAPPPITKLHYTFTMNTKEFDRNLVMDLAPLFKPGVVDRLELRIVSAVYSRSRCTRDEYALKCGLKDYYRNCTDNKFEYNKCPFTGCGCACNLPVNLKSFCTGESLSCPATPPFTHDHLILRLANYCPGNIVLVVEVTGFVGNPLKDTLPNLQLNYDYFVCDKSACERDRPIQELWYNKTHSFPITIRPTIDSSGSQIIIGPSQKCAIMYLTLRNATIRPIAALEIDLDIGVVFQTCSPTLVDGSFEIVDYTAIYTGPPILPNETIFLTVRLVDCEANCCSDCDNGICELRYNAGFVSAGERQGVLAVESITPTNPPIVSEGSQIIIGPDQGCATMNLLLRNATICSLAALEIDLDLDAFPSRCTPILLDGDFLIDSVDYVARYVGEPIQPDTTVPLKILLTACLGNCCGSCADGLCPIDYRAGVSSPDELSGTLEVPSISSPDPCPPI